MSLIREHLSSAMTKAEAQAVREKLHEFARLENINLGSPRVNFDNLIDVDADFAFHELSAENLCRNSSQEIDV